MRNFSRNALMLSLVLGPGGALMAGCGGSSLDTFANAGRGGSSTGGSNGGTNSGSSHPATAGVAGTGGSGVAGAGGSGVAGTGVSGVAGTGGSGGASAGTGGVTSPGANGGAAGNDNGGDTTGAAGEPGNQACNSVVQAATPVMSTHTADAAPVLAQGDIQPGTYYLTSYTFYDGTSGANSSIAETVEVTISNKTATLNEVDSTGATTTIAVVMGTPASAAPASIIATCSNLQAYQAVLGQELKAIVAYGVTGAAEDTLTVYVSTLRLEQVYKLEP